MIMMVVVVAVTTLMLIVVGWWWVAQKAAAHKAMFSPAPDAARRVDAQLRRQYDPHYVHGAAGALSRCATLSRALPSDLVWGGFEAAPTRPFC